MENIIEELIAIENEAEELMAKTMEDRRNLTVKIRVKTDEIKESIEKETTQKIKEMYDTAINDSKERVDQIKSEAQKRCSETELAYKENHNRWEQDIFERIINRR